MENNFRIGFSTDVHLIKSKKNTNIILGNKRITCDYYVVAESDGDILLHVISESILGALGLKDIGSYFKGKVLSLDILKFALKEMQARKYKINNIDLLIMNDEIYFKNHINNIVDSLIKILSIQKDQISLKATTSEKTNPKVVQAFSNILLIKS